MQSCRQMFEGSRGDGSGRDEQNMASSLSLLPCESSVSVKEDPDRIYVYIYIYICIYIYMCMYFTISFSSAPPDFFPCQSLPFHGHLTHMLLISSLKITQTTIRLN